MRISIDRTDRAYDVQKAKGVKRIILDGNEVLAITADDQEGYVKVFARSGEGNLQMDLATGEVKTLELRGKVVIEMDERRWDESRTGQAKVEVGRMPNGHVHVLVHSVARPGAIRRVKLERPPSDGLQLVQAIGIAAGGAAEHMCEQYGDRIDPSEVARTAVELARQMLSEER